MVSQIKLLGTDKYQRFSLENFALGKIRERYSMRVPFFPSLKEFLLLRWRHYEVIGGTAWISERRLAEAHPLPIKARPFILEQHRLTSSDAIKTFKRYHYQPKKTPINRPFLSPIISLRSTFGRKDLLILNWKFFNIFFPYNFKYRSHVAIEKLKPPRQDIYIYIHI